MIEYNIYAGPNGRVIYLYTTLRDNIIEADQLARQEMQLAYCLWNGNKDYQDALREAADYFIEQNLECTEDGIKDKAWEIYNSWLDKWGKYKAVLTSEDSINKDDLIRDYVRTDV